MEEKLLKILKRIVSEGYKLNQHHSNKEWKEILESGERIIINIKQNLEEEKVK